MLLKTCLRDISIHFQMEETKPTPLANSKAYLEYILNIVRLSSIAFGSELVLKLSQVQVYAHVQARV